LAHAKENLARLTDDVELAVHTAYNQLERTQQMLRVSEEFVALSQRVEPCAAARTFARGRA